MGSDKPGAGTGPDKAKPAKGRSLHPAPRDPNQSAVASGRSESVDGPVSPGASSRGRIAKARRKDETGGGGTRT